MGECTSQLCKTDVETDIHTVLCYVDNILLYSKDLSGREMTWPIGKFLDRVELSGARVQVSKTEMMKNEVPYLGFVVGKSGITIDPLYRKVLLDFPVPASPAYFSRFLGCWDIITHF